MNNSSQYHIFLESIRNQAKKILPPDSKITLFGSRARGDYRENSDWDIHIIIPGKGRIPFNLLSDYSYPLETMGIEMGEEINIIIYTEDEWENRKNSLLYENIKRDGIRL